MNQDKVMRVIFLLFTLLPLRINADVIYMIVAKDSSVQDLTPSQVRDLYLGVPVTQSGETVKAIDRKEEVTRIRERFFKNAIGRNMTQMRSLWSQLIFTGRGYPPPVAESLTDAMRQLKDAKEFTTFVDEGEFDSNNMRVVFKVQESK